MLRFTARVKNDSLQIIRQAAPEDRAAGTAFGPIVQVLERKIEKTGRK
jgi:hypothetical protein